MQTSREELVIFDQKTILIRSVQELSFLMSRNFAFKCQRYIPLIKMFDTFYSVS